MKLMGVTGLYGIILNVVVLSHCRSRRSTEEGRSFKNLAVTLMDPLRPLTFSYWFNDLPLTEEDAMKRGWRPQGNGCPNSSAKSNNSAPTFFWGQRYFPPSEPSIAVLYDKRGTCAGFQTIFDAVSLQNGSAHPDCHSRRQYRNNYVFAEQGMINQERIRGKLKFVLTAYFYQPDKICDSIRDPLLVKERGFGNTLYFQNGPSPQDLLVTPSTRKEAARKGWENDRCLPLNGYHNFMNTSQWDSEDCSRNFPAWLFYDEEFLLSGFGFSLPGCDPSPRFQHPPGFIVQYVTGSSCASLVADTIKYSNINIYLVPVANTLDDCFVDFLGIRQGIRYVCGLTRSLNSFCDKIFSVG